jgi:hypothetical protein
VRDVKKIYKNLIYDMDFYMIAHTGEEVESKENNATRDVRNFVDNFD